MPNIDRRSLLHTGIALAVPFAGMSLFSGCQQSKDDANSGSPDEGNAEKLTVKPKQESQGENMKIQYLEIVTADAEALCNQYSAAHEITFSEPVEILGNARTAKMNGGLIGIRGPMRENEAPVIRPYMLVEDLEKAVAAAAEAGAEVALPRMELPGHGTIAIVIQGGIECGFWQV